jgi:hypothetical protein
MLKQSSRCPNTHRLLARIASFHFFVVGALRNSLREGALGGAAAG